MGWIWIKSNKYPDYQNNYCNINAVSQEEKSLYKYCVAEFRKEFSFDRDITKIRFKTSADNFYHLYINDELYEIGPASSGGDFLCKKPLSFHYANISEIDVSGKNFVISAEVKLLGNVLTEYSKGHGGFYCDICFIDKSGNELKYETDETWQSKMNGSFTGELSFDSSKDIYDWSESEMVEDIWTVRDSYIETLSLNTVYSETITVKPNQTITSNIWLDKIYGIIPIFSSTGKCSGTLVSTEMEGQPLSTEIFKFNSDGRYMSFRMQSIGESVLTVNNTDEKDISLELIFIAPWYKINYEGSFECSDAELNKVYEVCKHTLKICRQSIHLDSTKHQEHLACTGDYYIETLMGLYCYGDMKLSEFDVMRTADWIVENKGIMFHTTYSLIWVQMLKDVYMITGNKSLLTYCSKALDILLERFRSYCGPDGLVENPHDYMFVDWTVVDGYSMHHPPKALGQSVLNMFYYKALTTAAEIYGFLGNNTESAKCSEESATLRTVINESLFDKDKNLYFDGKNDITDTSHWLPVNSGNKYFTKYPNILACAYGVADDDKAADIIERIIFNEELQDIQPYFTHYLLVALRKTGLFEKYGFRIFERWKPVVKECDKGLAEGWIAPEPNYSFDHSHAWGGTIAYHLPSVVCGMEILEPGMKKLRFNPKLYSLDYANMKISTVYGDISIRINRDSYEICKPDAIQIITD